MQNLPQDLPSDIPTPGNVDSHPIMHWRHLYVAPATPLAVYHLSHWQGTLSGVQVMFWTCEDNFCSADLAWFASGMSFNGNHHHLLTSFHPSLVAMVKQTRYPNGKVECKVLLAEVNDLMFNMVCFGTSPCWVQPTKELLRLWCTINWMEVPPWSCQVQELPFHMHQFALNTSKQVYTFPSSSLPTIQTFTTLSTCGLNEHTKT